MPKIHKGKSKTVSNGKSKTTDLVLGNQALVAANDEDMAPVTLKDLNRNAPVPVCDVEFRVIEKTKAFSSMKRTARFGLLLGALFCGGLFLYGGNAVIAGAVVANGMLASETGAKAVQHPQGGVLSELNVSEGDRVAQGQVLAKFDERTAEAELQAVETTLVNQLARLARLIAERDGTVTLAEVAVPKLELLSATEKTSAFKNEAIQLKLREVAREGQREILRERIEQARARIQSNNANLTAIDQQIASIKSELENLRSLLDRQLISASRVLNQERQISQLEASRASTISDNATVRGQIAQFNLGIAEIDQSLRSSLTDAISETRTAIAGLTKEQITASRRLEDLKVRSPQDGIVHQLALRTAGEVAAAGAVLMRIIPSNEALVGEIRIAPAEIDQLYPGQPAQVLFSAFDRGTTPQLNGEVRSVSPGLERDPTTGATYYLATVTVPEAELARLGDIELVPGMPVEAFIKTTDRTLLSFLLKPIRDQMRRALR